MVMRTLTLTLLFSFSYLIFLQGLQAQKIESSLLYELKAGEKIIHGTEYRLDFRADNTGYILFIQRQGLHYMVQNGKEIGPYNKIYNPYIDVEDYASTAFYYFVYDYLK